MYTYVIGLLGGLMENTTIFSYINVLDKAADASWLRHQAISNNIANVNTPGYKRKDVDFESQLMRSLGRFKYESMDEKVYGINTKDLVSSVYTDNYNHSYRLDGNNVDIDTENVYLAENQIKYNALLDSVKNQFDNLKLVMK